MSNYRDEAVAEVLRDTDTFADWLYSECFGADVCGERPHIKEASAEDFKHLKMPQLVALLFDAGQPANVTQAARDEISNRYLALPSTQAYIDRIVDRDETAHEHESMFDRIMGGHPLRSFPAIRRAA